jgi:GTP cyclohydrolase II
VVSAIDPALRAVERGVDDLRRGYPVMVGAGAAWLGVLPLDLASADTLARFEAALGQPAGLLLSGRRAATLKLTNARAAAGQPSVRVHRRPDLALEAWLAIADPLEDLAYPLSGPHRPDPLGDHQAAGNAAIDLLKLARLMPAGLVAPISSVPPGWTQITSDAIRRYPTWQAEALRMVARARVPLLAASAAEVVAFRAGDGGLEHLAIVIGDPPRDQPVLTRLHSECFTGDLLGSLKCDCGPQLRGALDAIGQAGAGVLLYLAQEGRGIGLINKLRAYALQDQGFDTVDANTRLGFEIDERVFAPAVRMLALLGFGSVRLMTNNPDKVAALQAAGLRVVERVAHQFPANAHNELYLATKRTRTGHLLT